MRKVLKNGFTFVGSIVLSWIVAGVVAFLTGDEGLGILAAATSYFGYWIMLFFLDSAEKSKEGKLSKPYTIAGITFVALLIYLLVLEIVVPTWRLFYVIGGCVVITGVGGFFSIFEDSFEFSYNESPRDDDFELNLWNQLVLAGQGRFNQLVLNKEIDNRKGLTLADIALVKSELRGWEVEELQTVLNFITLPLDYTVLTFSVKDLGSLSKLLPKKTLASLLAAVSAYKVFEDSINDFLTNFVTKIQSSLTSFDVLVALDVLALVASIALLIVVIVTFFRSFSTHTKRKQVKQILPKLLKDVLEEKQSQHYHSRQFPKRWLK